jgi:hypothetical protein
MIGTVLIVLLVLALFGGYGVGPGPYRTGGISLAGLFLLILILLLIFGHPFGPAPYW